MSVTSKNSISIGKVLLFLLFLSKSVFSENQIGQERSPHIPESENIGTVSEYIESASKTDASEKQRDPLWEAERLRRIRLDYDLTRQDLLDQLHKRIRNFEERELEQWLEEERFDRRTINGVERFISPSVSNLFFRFPDLYERKIDKDQKPFFQIVYDTVQQMRSNTDAKSRKFRLRMNVLVAADAVQEGTLIRCWLPYPKENAFQKELRLFSSIPNRLKKNSSFAPHRSVYLESHACSGSPTLFSIDYSYISISRLTVIDPEKGTDKVPEEVRSFIQEKPPHVVFLPEFQSTLDEIVGDNTNPYHIAKKIYMWMSENFHYSYAREYSTIRNISRYTYQKRYGDCGQLALLFMTLCRMKGIPARWESGWMLYPGAKNLHDWCVIYLDPYGWIPVDPNMGILAVHAGGSFTEQQREKVREFYFGYMDPYRLVVNSDHGAELDPPKKHFRSDTVDFQRGEVETKDRNLYYDDFSYHLYIIDSETITYP